ncbi:MAG: plastocyanin/azurin family copper-binding protein [Flavobacteriales bacterium]
MMKLFTLIAVAPLAVAAQTTFPVSVGGSLLDPNNPPFYSPQFLTINVGDIVQWNCPNGGGSHNVYAELDMFPDNPDGFSSSGITQNAPWTYSHTFTAAGVWDFHCTGEFQGQFHSTTQFGTITVVDPNGVATVGTSRSISLFPVPANDKLMLSLKGCTGVTSVDIMAADGRYVRTQAVQDNRVNTVNLDGLTAGQYYLLMDRSRRTIIKPFVKQ